jgi:hypothetical protein
MSSPAPAYNGFHRRFRALCFAAMPRASAFEILPELRRQRNVVAAGQPFQQQGFQPGLGFFLLGLAQERTQILAHIAVALGGELVVDEFLQGFGRNTGWPRDRPQLRSPSRRLSHSRLLMPFANLTRRNRVSGWRSVVQGTTRIPVHVRTRTLSKYVPYDLTLGAPCDTMPGSEFGGESASGQSSSQIVAAPSAAHRGFASSTRTPG